MNNSLPGHSLRLARLAATCIMAAGLAPLSAAHAQQWTISPEVRVGYEFDDNARLSSDDATAQEIDGFNVEGSLGLGYATERSNFVLTPRLRSRIYDEVPDVDSDDQYLKLDFAHETLKSEFGVRGNYSREAVRTAERVDADVDVEDPDEIPDDPTGVVGGNERRLQLVVAPYWSHNLTERTEFGLAAQYMDVDYEEGIVSSHVDYRDFRVGGSLGRSFTERTRGYLNLSARRYENDVGANDTDGLGAAVGLTSELSQTTRLQAEIGYEDTELTQTGESESNVVGRLNVVRSLETVKMLAQYRRSVSAGGSGRVTLRDSVNFNVNKQFTERVAGGVGVSAYQVEGIGEAIVANTFTERDGVTFRADLEVALSRAFLLEAEYRYSRLDRSGTEAAAVGTADSNNIILWLVYRPTPIVN